MRRSRFHRFQTALCALVLAFAAEGCQDSDRQVWDQPPTGEWLTYGGSLARHFSRTEGAGLTPTDAKKLVPLWRFQTGAVVTASPILAYVDLPSGLRERLLFIPSWDGHFYALRASDGSLVWSHRFKPHPGASFPQAGSAGVADLDGRRRVYVASGMTMYSFDAATGEPIWEFDAGTGCTDCDFLTERNEILSSPAIFDDTVYFGMDINDFGNGKGGFYAVDAREGTLRWYFDVVTGTACHPDENDKIRRFDGYHTSEELGLPGDFFDTRKGCNFDRTGVACGNVWSSAAIDPARRMLYTASSNCDTDFDPTTPDPEPPMPPYDLALFVLHTDTGEPVWKWRAYEIDNDDLAIGAVPNLFRVEIGGKQREVVGFGQKDGFYYLLDRDGVNELTGEIEPYWRRQVVPGGDIGGIIASAAVLDGKIHLSTAVGTDLSAPQLPAAFTLDASTGEILWANPNSVPSFAPTSAVPGIAFMGSIGGSIFIYDADTGEEVNRLSVRSTASSPAVVVD
ncbi:MAG: PQQ-binding-like beta-propeller repeat protein, partial [bacterium]